MPIAPGWGWFPPACRSPAVNSRFDRRVGTYPRAQRTPIEIRRSLGTGERTNGRGQLRAASGTNYLRLIRNLLRYASRGIFASLSFSLSLSFAASSRGSLTFPISTVGYQEYTRLAIRVQRPNEEDPQAGGELSIRRVAGQSIRFKGSGIGIETEIPRRRRAAGFGWSAAPSPCPGITPKSLLRRVLRPLCARKPHKLRPEGRDRKLGGEQVREFRRTHTERVCTCTRALSQDIPPSRPSTCHLRKPVQGGKAAPARATPGIILA